jgi:hypothetical protein
MGCGGSKAPPPPTERELEEQAKATTARAEAAAADTEHKKAEARAKEANKSREAADERIARFRPCGNQSSQCPPPRHRRDVDGVAGRVSPLDSIDWLIYAGLNSAIGKEEDGHAAEEVAFASLAARQRAVSTAANDCRARGDALRAQLETTTEERDEYQNSVIKLEQELKAAKEERDAATKAAGVIQAKLDAANEEIEKNAVRARCPRFGPRVDGVLRVPFLASTASMALTQSHAGHPRRKGRLHQDAHPDAQGQAVARSKFKSY